MDDEVFIDLIEKINTTLMKLSEDLEKIDASIMLIGGDGSYLDRISRKGLLPGEAE